MKSSKSVNKNSAVTWRYLPKKFILPAIIVLISAMFYYFSSGFNTVAGIAQLNEINSVDKDVKQSGISDVAIIEANEKETLKEIQTDQLNETKSLIYLSRPSWRLKGSLSDHFDRLKSQYEEGDVNAAYILSKNLRYCWYIPSNQQSYEKALDLANENGESDRFMNRLTEKYKFCDGINKEQRSLFYKYIEAAASKGYVPAQEAFANTTPILFMKSQGHELLDRDAYVEKRDEFVQQKLSFLEDAALNGSIRVLVKLSGMQFSQTYGENGLIKPTFRTIL